MELCAKRCALALQPLPLLSSLSTLSTFKYQFKCVNCWIGKGCQVGVCLIYGQPNVRVLNTHAHTKKKNKKKQVSNNATIKFRLLKRQIYRYLNQQISRCSLFFVLLLFFIEHFGFLRESGSMLPVSQPKVCHSFQMHTFGIYSAGKTFRSKHFFPLV